MRATITDETLACLAELNADIAALRETLEYIEPIQNRLTTLIDELEGAKHHERYNADPKKSNAYRKPIAY